jgi:hypothetical protein
MLSHPGAILHGTVNTQWLETKARYFSIAPPQEHRNDEHLREHHHRPHGGRVSRFEARRIDRRLTEAPPAVQ